VPLCELCGGFEGSCKRCRAGDTAVVEDGYFKLLGRTSVDIIKHGGYKASREHCK
jgi:acyl-coenzyme A synthetase/AMP-(fatty) acid ligase